MVSNIHICTVNASYSDLLWSDPIEEETALGLTEDEFLDWFELDFIPNPTRGCGYVFGYAAIANFLANNNLLTVIRAHEVQKVALFFLK